MKRLLAISVPLFMLFAGSAHAQDTLFADMGGQAGIDRIVDASVDNYLADDRIKAIFDESNIDRLRAEFSTSSEAEPVSVAPRLTCMTLVAASCVPCATF